MNSPSFSPLLLTGPQSEALNKHLFQWLSNNGLLVSGATIVAELRVVNHPPCSISVVRDLDGLLATPLSSLELESLKTQFKTRILECVGLVTLGELVRLSEQDVYRYRNVGRKLVGAIQNALALFGLRLGMKVDLGPSEKKAILELSPIDRIHYPDMVVSALRNSGTLTFAMAVDTARKEAIMSCLASLVEGPMTDPRTKKWLEQYPSPERRYEYLMGRISEVCPWIA
jgi:hypothetical protein